MAADQQWNQFFNDLYILNRDVESFLSLEFSYEHFSSLKERIEMCLEGLFSLRNLVVSSVSEVDELHELFRVMLTTITEVSYPKQPLSSHSWVQKRDSTGPGRPKYEI